MKLAIIRLARSWPGRLNRALRDEAHSVEVVTGIDDAVWVCSVSDVDVLIACVEDPGPEVDLAAKLRLAGLVTPLLVVADRTATGAIATALDAGVDDYVTRPVPISELTARLRALARRGPELGPLSTLESAGVVMDLMRRDVCRAGVRVPLSPQQFALLECFLRHPGLVLTRDVLLDQVWGLNAEPDSNVVDQAVAALRRRIDHPFGAATLEAVRGLGYRWAA